MAKSRIGRMPKEVSETATSLAGPRRGRPAGQFFERDSSAIVKGANQRFSRATAGFLERNFVAYATKIGLHSQFRHRRVCGHGLLFVPSGRHQNTQSRPRPLGLAMSSSSTVMEPTWRLNNRLSFRNDVRCRTHSPESSGLVFSARKRSKAARVSGLT
jgi:hypothetical protein